MMKHSLISGVFIVLLTLLSGCSGDDRELMVTALQSTINVGTKQHYRAVVVEQYGRQSDVTTTVSWSSSDNDLATIDSDGVVSAVAEGEVEVTAEIDGLSTSVVLQVTDKVATSLTVLPAEAVTLVGLNTQYYATLNFEDGSSQDATHDVRWASEAGDVAAVAAHSGLVTGVSEGGPVDIRASFGDLLSSGNIVVSNAAVTAMEIAPNPSDIIKGSLQQYRASILLETAPVRKIDVTDDVTWSVASPATAEISNDSSTKGVLRALNVGTSQVKARLQYAETSISASAELTVNKLELSKITVSPKDVSVVKGTYGDFVATGEYSDGNTYDVTEQVVWSSSKPEVGNIIAHGVDGGRIYGVNAGKIDITAILGEQSDVVTATVRAPNLETITVSPETSLIPKGLKQLYTAEGHFSDGTREDISRVVHWSSGDEGIAVMDARHPGLAHTVSEGRAIVRARFTDELAEAALTVAAPALKSLKIIPLDISIPKRVNFHYKVTGHYDNGTDIDITDQVIWSSGGENVASMSNVAGHEGEAYSQGAGETEINAKFGGHTDSTSLTVTGVSGSYVTSNCEKLKLQVGETTRCHCLLHLISGTDTFDCTALADYIDSPSSIVKLSDKLGEEGWVTGVSPGSTDVNIIFDKKNGHVSFSVID